MSPYSNVCSNRKETTKRSASRNIRFIQTATSIVKSTRLKPYSCKYSKRIYTQHQLLVLILFRDFRNQHYREFVEDIGDMERVQGILGLSVIPHFTTLQKFLCRIKSLYLRLTFKKTMSLFYSTDDVIPITAIDSSGFTSGYCSHYFSERTGKIRKHFLKTSISVDTDQQVITGFVASNSRVHDTRHAVKLLRQCHNIRKSDCYVMDRGYDSEAIHRLIREDLHADSVIPIRSWNNEIISGKYRQEMALQFNDVVYPRRQLVENKFSVLKRKFDGDLKARIFLIQMKEIAMKMIVCNLHRHLQFVVVEVFYRAKSFEVMMGADAPIPPFRCLPPPRRTPRGGLTFCFLITFLHQSISNMKYGGIACAPALNGAGLVQGGCNHLYGGIRQSMAFQYRCLG